MLFFQTKIAQASVESERLIRDYQEKIASLEQLNKNLERDLDEAVNYFI